MTNLYLTLLDRMGVQTGAARRQHRRVEHLTDV